MKVLVLYNIAEHLKTGIPSDLACEHEIEIIVPAVVTALQKQGHKVSTLITGFDLWEQLKTSIGTVDLVFNLAEAFGGGNTNEAVVPAMLEALDIPFTGADTRSMLFARDKEKTKVYLQSHGIPIVPHQLFKTPNDPLLESLSFPLIVKPVRQEASIGIYFDSVVTNELTLRTKISDTLERYHQPALVEEFIEGRELSVGILGNAPQLHVFPIVEFCFPESPSPIQNIRSYEYKWAGKPEHMVEANLPKHVTESLKTFSMIAFAMCDCLDYARFDYRLGNESEIFFLEVNYNPGIGPNAFGLSNTMTMMASLEGIAFEQLVAGIINVASHRYNLF